MTEPKLFEKIKKSVQIIERDKNNLLVLLEKAGIDSEDEPCEAIETLISAVEELKDVSW